MNNFTPLKRNCPICNSIRRDCRQNKQNGIVHCRADLSIIPQGWKALGQDKWGFEMYAQASDEQSSPGWQQRQQERKLQQQRQKEELTQGALSESDRDQAIRRIHRYFGISSKHRDNLRARGLTDAHIDHLPYFSFHPSQEVPQFTPANLPGVRRGKLSIKESGFACPIPNIDGQFIGWQNRFDNTENGKYRWPSGEKSAHLPNGELPIGVYRPDCGVTRRAIGHSEGFLKADLIAQRWGLPTLGAASANFAASPEQWQDSLENLSAQLGTRIVYWFADAGAPSNFNVTSQYRKAWEKLASWGYSVKVVWWGQVEKSAGDADEISQEVRESAQLISIEEYLAIAREHGGIRESSYTTSRQELDKTINRDQWELKFGIKNWVSDWIEQHFKKAQPKTLRETSTQLTSQVTKPLRGGNRESGIGNRAFNTTPESPESDSAVGGQRPTAPPEQERLSGQGWESRQKTVPTPDSRLPTPFFTDLTYQAGKRLQTWQEAVAAGYKHILDASHTGAGKSHAVAIANPNTFEAQRLFYCSGDAKNPTTALLEQNYTHLPPRHNGLVQDLTRVTPSGQPFVRRPKPGEEPDTPGNCPRTELFGIFQAKNYNLEVSKTSPICETCKVAFLCQTGTGHKYGATFRGDRQAALGSDRIRSHPDSLPQQDWDYSSEILFWDEPGQLLKPMQEIEVTLADFDQVFAELEAKAPEVHASLRDLRLALRPLLAGEVKQPYHGWDDAALRALLPQKPANLSSIINHLTFALQPDFSFLENDPDQISPAEARKSGISLSALRAVNRGFRREAHEEFSRAFQKIALNWLVPFLEIWNGDKGAMRLQWQKLLVYVADERYSAIAATAKANIWLDATMTKEQLALLLGVDESEIYVIQEEAPDLSNLRILQVTGLGKLGKDRSKSLESRVDALKDALKERIPGIVFGDWKNQTQTGDAYWFGNLRGSNEFENASALAVFGIPYQNVGHLQALYQTLTGEFAPLDKEQPHEGLQRFIEAHVQAEIIQALGRLRASRRPDQPLTFIFAGDYDLSFLGLPVEQLEAFQICREAGTASQITFWQITEALRSLHDRGQKLTTQALATVSRKSKALISKIASQFGGFERFKKCLLALLGDLYSTGEQIEFTSEEEKYFSIYLPASVDVSVQFLQEEAVTLGEIEQSLEGVEITLTSTIESFGIKKTLEGLKRLPTGTKANLLSYLLAGFPGMELLRVLTGHAQRFYQPFKLKDFLGWEDSYRLPQSYLPPEIEEAFLLDVFNLRCAGGSLCQSS